MTRNGWLKLWYKTEDNPISQDIVVLGLFTKLLLLASRKESTLLDGTVIQRGQVVVSQRALAKAVNIGHKQLRNAFQTLHRRGIVELKTAHTRAHAPTIVTICKYDTYQSRESTQGTSEGTGKAQVGHSEGTEGAPLEDSKKEDSKKERRIKTPKPPAGDSPIGEELMTKWNNRVEELKDERLKPIRSITPDRRRIIASRMEDPTWRLAFLDALVHLPFDNTDSFKFQPTFDWLIKNSTNAQKVAEGNYDASRHKPTNGQPHQKLLPIPRPELPFISKRFAEMTVEEFDQVKLLDIPIGRDSEYFAEDNKRHPENRCEAF